MTYELKTEKVKLGEGQSAVFYQELLHGTQRAVSNLTRPYLKSEGDKFPKLTVKEGERDVQVETAKALYVELDKVDWEAVNDAIILGQVKEWSFGEVTQEVLDGLPERFREALKSKSDALYGGKGPLPVGGGVN